MRLGTLQTNRETANMTKHKSYNIKNNKQESIPVGCVLTASLPSLRVVGVGVGYHPPRYTHPCVYPTPSTPTTPGYSHRYTFRYTHSLLVHPLLSISTTQVCPSLGIPDPSPGKDTAPGTWKEPWTRDIPQKGLGTRDTLPYPRYSTWAHPTPPSERTWDQGPERNLGPDTRDTLPYCRYTPWAYPILPPERTQNLKRDTLPPEQNDRHY